MPVRFSYLTGITGREKTVGDSCHSCPKFNTAHGLNCLPCIFWISLVSVHNYISQFLAINLSFVPHESKKQRLRKIYRDKCKHINFFGLTQMESMKHWYMSFIKIKYLCFLTNTKKIKIQTIHWEIMFKNHLFIK